MTADETSSLDPHRSTFRGGIRPDRREIATVASYVAALGGRLRLVADFGEQSVLIDDNAGRHPLSAVGE